MKKNKLTHNKLAEGEATGHAHRLTGGVLYADDIPNTIRIEPSAEELTITHEEHGPIIIPSNGCVWRSGQVIEKNFLNDLVAPVRD